MLHLRIGWTGGVLVTLAAAAATAEPPKAIWQIGTADHNYQEFALAGDHQGYRKAFPQDVVFRVGRSDPKTDWPWIHPGPRDDWAGNREHPFAIVFDMPEAPAGGCVLRIDVLDAQSSVTPQLRVDVNGTAGVFRVNRGAGDRALIDPSKAKPQVLAIPIHPSLLRAGENRITLTTVDGSWILYDAVTLQETGAGRSAVEIQATPTILFVRRDDRSMQLVRVRLTGLAPKEQVPLTVEAGGEKYDVAVAVPTLGPVELDVPVPPADAPTKVTLSVPAGAGTATTTFELKPQKRWHIFCAPSTHTDIGYTDTQSNVIGVHNRNTDLAIRLCEQFPAYKWNLESSWAAQMFRRDASDQHGLERARIRNGAVLRRGAGGSVRRGGVGLVHPVRLVVLLRLFLPGRCEPVFPRLLDDHVTVAGRILLRRDYHKSRIGPIPRRD